MYSARFELAERASGRTYLKLNEASMANARVKLNGTDIGILRWKPYILDISDVVKQGMNKLEIETSTTLVNAFGPNRHSGIKEVKGIGPHTFPEMSRFSEEYELFDNGFKGVGIFCK